MIPQGVRANKPGCRVREHRLREFPGDEVGCLRGEEYRPRRDNLLTISILLGEVVK